MHSASFEFPEARDWPVTVRLQTGPHRVRAQTVAIVVTQEGAVSRSGSVMPTVDDYRALVEQVAAKHYRSPLVSSVTDAAAGLGIVPPGSPAAGLGLTAFSASEPSGTRNFQLFFVFDGASAAPLGQAARAGMEEHWGAGQCTDWERFGASDGEQMVTCKPPVDFGGAEVKVSEVTIWTAGSVLIIVNDLGSDGGAVLEDLLSRLP